MKGKTVEPSFKPYMAENHGELLGLNHHGNVTDSHTNAFMCLLPNRMRTVDPAVNADVRFIAFSHCMYSNRKWEFLPQFFSDLES